jgi:Leucine-rich repeat (LRR) protein
LPKLTYTTPPPPLMRELCEVESDAGALAAELARANRLPSDFPAEQLQELLVALKSLPTGTAEGCRQPLEYARARLPAIRRQFIKTEEESRQSPVNEDAPPPLTRGMTIDVRIGALVNSVTTALDEYRALASIQDDDATDTAPSREISVTSQDVVDAMAASQSAERALGEHVNELERIGRPDSITADNLKRQMRDTRGLLSLARIELRMPAFVPRWYRKTVNTVRDYPRILETTAMAIRIGVDVARPMIDAWHRFEHGFSRLVLDSVEQAATELLVVARKWEVESAGRREEPAPDATEPPPDFDIAKARAIILGGEAPPPTWRPWIWVLNFFDANLNDLAPLSGLSALQSLSLNGTQVSDLSPLSGLSALQSLSLNGTQVRDVSPLSGLSTLQRLSLKSTQVIDVSPLSGLSALQDLDLKGTPVSDVSPLSDLAALVILNLMGTQVSDVTPLSRLSALKILDLAGTPISDVSLLSDLAALIILDLNGTSVSDVSPLSGLSALQSLDLTGTQVSDVSPLSGLSALQDLDLPGTQVNDVSPLSGLSALQNLDLTGTQVSDVSPLSGLTALQILDLRDTPVSDVSPFSGLPALRHLRLERTQVSDVSPLSDVAALEILDLRGTRVSDVSSLSGLAALEILDLNGTRVSDVSPLSGLSALKVLDLAGTRVSDVSPLSGLSALEGLDLTGTPVSDVSPLSGLAALLSLDLMGTRVRDVSPLSGLSALKIHGFWSTRSLARSAGAWPRAGAQTPGPADLS